MLLTGLTEKMRNDFNMMKDLAVHTRLSPEQRQREIGKLVDCMKKYVTWVPPVLRVIHIFHDKLISCKILVNLTFKKKKVSARMNLF